MWWIIIGAVIALVVLVILMLLFTSKTGRLEGGLLDCQSKGGTCDEFSDTKPCTGTISSAFDCKDSNQKCCFLTKKS